ncbi:von Willebrand factor type A domain protein [Rubripirellula obstinata]|uniref:von Willebrand factor type A domain protein n=2 Tax=Rubripirellula obstinata TaxID=406547 RepID=A0A5B1CEH7_9BACT|nr:VWA domain-containing protein [Rubripirellula obstinata]KAA1259557.1 von Willebrand factor type A domain protein [Rubripirellula obstinata]
MSLFLHPWFLLLLPVAFGLAFRAWRREGVTVVSYSSAATRWNLRPSLRQRLAWLPKMLTLVALVTMILALARPRDGKERTSVDSEGIAIELVVDRSSSMRALDFKIDGESVDRLSAVKDVATKFVLGDSGTSSDDANELAGRLTDRIGLVQFAGYADAITPPTLDHSFLAGQLDRIRIADSQAEGGTAIGDAVSLAAERLSSLTAKNEKQIQSKVIILLTDGENTAGSVEPMQSAELAKSLGVKVYAIGVGTQGQAPFPVRQTRDGRMLVRMMDVSIDEDTLKAIADTTGGRYFRATDTDSLKQIYQEIDQLERTKFEVNSYVDYKELAVRWIQTSWGKLPPLLLIALFALGMKLLLSQTLFRSLA